MARINIRYINNEDRSVLVKVLTEAFATDPLLRWVYEEDDRYRRYFEEFIYTYGGDPFLSGSGFTWEDGGGGVALWHPLECGGDGEALEEFLIRTATRSRVAEVVRVFKEFEQHHPSEPHCFVTFVGRDPSSDRNTFLLFEALYQHCDEKQLCMAGDVTSRICTRYYMRTNSKIVAPVQYGTSPTYYSMIRRPQSIPRGHAYPESSSSTV